MQFPIKNAVLVCSDNGYGYPKTIKKCLHAAGNCYGYAAVLNQMPFQKNKIFCVLIKILTNLFRKLLWIVFISIISVQSIK